MPPCNAEFASLVHDVSSSAYSKLLGFTELGDLADMFGVIELSFMLLVGLAPQIEPSTSEAVLLGNFTHAGGLQLSELGLGSGGVLSKRAKVQQAALNHASGRAETVGGVRVNAQKEGVKLTFVSGRELLITPSACIHLRSGEHTLAFFGGVRLCLADGSVVTVKRGTSPKRPLTSVVVEDRGRVRRIWSGSRRVVHGSYSKAFQGSTLLVLGDGGSLYRANAAGPVVALSRVLCPADQVNNVPARRLVIVGDVLARSLQLLPKHAPRKSVQFPQVEEAAQRFAALAPLFHQNVARVPGSVGELWFALADQYRLKVSTAERAILKIGLYRGSSLIPGVEWIVASRTTIHFVRPDGGASGGPRYFMRGIDLRGILSGSLPLTDSVASRFRVSEAVSAMGGRQPKSLQVRVASRARRNP